VTVSVVVPFHQNAEHLAACLAAVSSSLPKAEVLVAIDGAVEDYQPVAERVCAMCLVVPDGPAGPAIARNQAARRATGEILVFVDADVVPAKSALPGLCAHLEHDPDVAAVFGAYDHAPAAPNFVSQFKNLSHAYVHEVGKREASTFWAGLGAVRASAFRHVAGFDERFVRPSVEDVELGHRLRRAGFTIRLDPGCRGKHLKRWTLRGCVRTDLLARGIPWTQLLHRLDSVPDDLNTSRALRASVVASYALVGALLAAAVVPYVALAVPVLLAMLVALNRGFYLWLRQRRGWWFVVRAFPLHVLHHLCNGVSYVVGTVLHVARRRGHALPGSLPLEPWPVSGHPSRAA
jgi:GT2 family glycosyltransferase